VSAQPRIVTAGNAGPLTLDGTRTHLVGERLLAVIDAGPALDAHMSALRAILADADRVAFIVTHGHSDHAAAARVLAGQLGTDVWGPAGVEGVTRPLADGESVTTDAGDLITVDTPGHARHHIGLHWPAGRAFFAGDLLVGAGDTVWVGEYAGCVADYLASLERVSALDVDVIYPAHGPTIENPPEVIDSFARHRRARIAQMEALLARSPEATTNELLEGMYGGSLPEGLRRAAEKSVAALEAHVRRSSDGSR
jgi:glyoxylase-like metal-dependent hydrolase (beta-lactamase superfamily II)